METGLLLIFWYGVLHAFGPDHLVAIADFSIGKQLKRTLAITLAFAVGHGVMLYGFAELLSRMEIPEWVTGSGDLLASLVIVGIGIYLLAMVATDRIQFRRHTHEGRDHIHIWFGAAHDHNRADVASALSIGALMGIGGVRGMLITLGMLEAHAVDVMMIFAFVAGVSVIFVGFGLTILLVNQRLLTTRQNVRRVFAFAGTASVLIGANMLLG